MARPKGSKNKSKTTGPDILAGNPEFNINDIDQGVTDYSLPYEAPEPTSVLGSEVAMAAITDEDLALDRELQQMANEEPVISDNAPAVLFKKEKDRRHLLSEYMDDYKPAKTINELNEQVHLAKESDCDSIEATENLVRHFCRKNYPDDVGYFIYHDIKVYIAGFFEKSFKRDAQTIEQKLFGAKS